MPMVMTDLIIGHTQGTHLFCQLCSHIKCSVAKRSQSGRVAHVGVAVMCYPDPYIVPAIWIWFCSLIRCQEQKKLLKLGPAESTQWGTAPESFYRAMKVQIRCNLPFVANSPPTRQSPPRPPSKHFVFQRLTFSSCLVFFLLSFFKSYKQPGSKSGRQPADVAGPCVQVCNP